MQRALTELEWGKRPQAPALPHALIPAAERGKSGEQKPEKVSLSWT
jgi:hypothetical protein